MALHASVNSIVAIFSGPGHFTITSVSIGADNDHINVTYMQVSHVTTIYIWLHDTCYYDELSMCI